MKTAKITSTKLRDEVIIPRSKSYAARMLIIGALSESKITISDIPEALDTQDLINALKFLGLCKWEDRGVVFDHSFPKDEVYSSKAIDINLGEGGTTIRFMLSLLALGRNSYTIHVHPRFKKRPYQEQLETLQNLGVTVFPSDKEDILCTIRGPFKKNQSIFIDCSKTTQIASSLCLIKKKISLKLSYQNLNSSLSYLKMTEELSKNKVETHQDSYIVPVDMSSASYFIALAALSHTTTFKGITCRDPLQADDRLLDLIDHTISPELTVKKQKLKAFNIDASNCIDLVPTLAFMASFIDGESYIFGIENLVYKESNRLEGICDILSFFNIRHKRESSSLRIYGDPKLINHKSDLLIPLPDHRLVMMGSLFFKMQGFGEIGFSECVDKSFPGFFTNL
jgi:3-phosphoshikimate 1-carboxyvinyltransferase